MFTITILQQSDMFTVQFTTNCHKVKDSFGSLCFIPSIIYSEIFVTLLVFVSQWLIESIKIIDYSFKFSKIISISILSIAKATKSLTLCFTGLMLIIPGVVHCDFYNRIQIFTKGLLWKSLMWLTTCFSFTLQLELLFFVFIVKRYYFII